LLDPLAVFNVIVTISAMNDMTYEDVTVESVIEPFLSITTYIGSESRHDITNTRQRRSFHCQSICLHRDSGQEDNSHLTPIPISRSLEIIRNLHESLHRIKHGPRLSPYIQLHQTFSYQVPNHTRCVGYGSGAFSMSPCFALRSD
jgi:hypothetical protein